MKLKASCLVLIIYRDSKNYDKCNFVQRCTRFAFTIQTSIPQKLKIAKSKNDPCLLNKNEIKGFVFADISAYDVKRAGSHMSAEKHATCAAQIALRLI